MIYEALNQNMKVRIKNQKPDKKLLNRSLKFHQCKAAHTASAIKGASNMFNEVRKKFFVIFILLIIIIIIIITITTIIIIIILLIIIIFIIFTITTIIIIITTTMKRDQFRIQIFCSECLNCRKPSLYPSKMDLVRLCTSILFSISSEI